MQNKKTCIVMGAGWMAQEYLKALNYFSDIGVGFYAPSEKNKSAIEGLGGKFYSNLDQALDELSPQYAIVATSVEALPKTIEMMVEHKIPNILAEKPGYLTANEGIKLIEGRRNSKIVIGYNRRFYPSVSMALSLIEKSKEIFQAVTFEFTELSAAVGDSTKYPPNVKNHWVHANSSHVIDLAFFPVGLPNLEKTKMARQGSLAWHSSAAVMIGSGLTTKNIAFNYGAYWSGVGRWSVEWITDKSRYIFRPMEKLQVQRLGSFNYEEIPLVTKFEKAKPGLGEQLEAFFYGVNAGRLLSIEDSMLLHQIMSKMAGYTD